MNTKESIQNSFGSYFIGYFKYEVVAQTEIVNERPMVFPTVTICNNNPFTSLVAQTLIKNVSLMQLNADLDNSGFIEKLDKLSIATVLTQMLAASSHFTNDMRKQLGLFLSFFTLNFNGK